MSKGRLEAFSDGVIAIIITIMVLELHVPHGADVEALRPLLPKVLAYVLSFVYVGIYWNNHHHMLQISATVNGTVLWANLHLLFWLSLFPFVTAWLGENHDAVWPTALYGVVLLLAGFAYLLLQQALLATHGKGSKLAAAVGRHDFKGRLSVAMYAAAVAMAFVEARLSQLIYAAVALVWLVPDRRIEAVVRSS
jgi:uncharacterized membrane protein